MIARNPQLGVAALLAIVYGPLVFLNLRLGIGIWIALEMLLFTPQIGQAALGARLLIIVAAIGTLGARRGLGTPFRRPAAAAPAIVALLLTWL